MHKLRFLVFLLVWLCLVEKAFSDEVKTIDGDVIEGDVVGADEEYLSVRQKGNSINFIQWRIISLISRDKEIIIVSHDGNQKKFSILKTVNSLSAKDITLTTADTISSIYPQEMLAHRQFFVNETEQPVKVIANGSRDTKDASQKTSAHQDKPWSGNVDAGLTLRSGNDQIITTSVKTGFALERPRDNLYFNSLFLYENKDGKKDVDEQRGAAKYERLFLNKWYSFYQESLEHDEIEKLDLRSITSSGIGYRFIERENLKYKSEIGPSVTYEIFRNNVKTSLGLRIGNYLDWQIFDSTKLYANVDFLPSPGDLIKWRLESDVGLRHDLNKHLSINIDWIDKYDSKPPEENVSNNNATILSTLGYNF